MGFFAILDCNNFYASCERLFDPRLENKPVVVLSNNDGCVIARSQEAKRLKIQMGQPYYQIKDFCTYYKVHVFSSNYRLYGDLSRRVMEILLDSGFDVEVYSIDEAFFQFPPSISAKEAEAICFELRKKIKKWVGIPTAIGLAPTKTLAKVANDRAKKSGSGVFSLCHPEIRQSLLEAFPVEDVWGVGRNNKIKLNRHGIYTAKQFCDQEPLWVRKFMGVVGERMLWELRGVSCLPIENVFIPKQSITCSRSFGKKVTEMDELAEALSTFVNTASTQLRKQGSFAQGLYIFLESVIDPRIKQNRYYSHGINLPYATQDTAMMISYAKYCLHQIYKKMEAYRKCGIVLLDLVQKSEIVNDLFNEKPNPKRCQLMKACDAINARYGKESVFWAAMGTKKAWKARSDKCSRCYTTKWIDLAVAHAK
jgi:DNA polymerase V